MKYVEGNDKVGGDLRYPHTLDLGGLLFFGPMDFAKIEETTNQKQNTSNKIKHETNSL